MCVSYVVGSSTIVTEDLGRVVAEEKSTVVLEVLLVLIGVAHVDFQVLRGNNISKLKSGLDRANNDGEAVLQSILGGLGSRERLELLSNLSVDRINDRLGGSDQNCSSIIVVLSLGEKVGGDNGRVGSFISNYKAL
jgi:hypothetical protein